MRLRGASAGHGEVVHHSYERPDALGEVAGFGGPVVHLGVDVDGVFATPRRVRAFVPQPLQARRLTAGTRGRDEKVAAVLVVERGQLRVEAFGEVLDALVRGQFHGCALSEIKSDAAEQLLVIGLVRDVQRVEGLPARCGDLPFRRAFRIATEVGEGVVTRRSGDQQHDFVRVGHGHGPLPGGSRAAFGDDPDAGLIFQRALDAISLAAHAAHDQRIAAFGLHRGRHRRPHARCEGNLPGLIGLQPHDDHPFRRARKNFPRVAHAFACVIHRGRSRREIQNAPVVFYGRCSGKVDQQIAHGLIRHLFERSSHDLRVNESFGRRIVAFKNQPPHLGERVRRVGIHGVIRPACPERAFVQLQPLLVHAAENHRADATVADGQRLDPLFRRLAIPEAQRLDWCGRVTGELYRVRCVSDRAQKFQRKSNDEKSRFAFHRLPENTQTHARRKDCDAFPGVTETAAQRRPPQVGVQALACPRHTRHRPDTLKRELQQSLHRTSSHTPVQRVQPKLPRNEGRPKLEFKL